MAITSAVKKGSVIYVYDGNRQLFCKPGDEVKGYTGNSVSIKKGSVIYTYNETGRQISSTPAR